MAARNPTARLSYHNCFPDAVVLSSKDHGWHGLTANLDHFYLPFDRDTFCYQENLVCINVGEPARLTHTIEGQSFRGWIGRGEFLMTPAAQAVKWRLETEADALSLLLQPAFVGKVATELDLNPDRIELLPSIAVRDSRLETIGACLLEELRSGGLHGRVYADHLASALAVVLLRRYSVRPPAQEDRIERLPDQRLRRVVAYIQANLGDSSLSLGDLAAVAHLSPYHFARRFKEAMGVSPHQYLIHQRVERAQRLLRDGQETITKIASDVGFSDHSHLCRHFKRIVNLTPAEFRAG
jgi:AraC family transcriptional regulator